jgi:polysaccharide export outer membrane protein
MMPLSVRAQVYNPNAFNPANNQPAPLSSGVDYVLGAGDELKFDLYGEENLFPTPYTVLVDGSISLPFIGRVVVSGLTIDQARELISSQYLRFYKRPQLTVALVKARDIKISIAGEVLRPGPQIIPASEPVPTVGSLIKLAGGHTQSADLQKIQVRRPRRDGGQEVLSADMLSLIRDGDGSQNLLLRDGDTVIVPAATTPDLSISATFGQNSLTPDSSEPLNVAVIGEVYRPGPYVITASNTNLEEAGDTANQSGASLRGQPTVTQAIQRAGGIKPEANVREIQVRRLTRTGTEQVIQVDLWKLLQEGDLKQDLALQNQDTIIIPESTTLTSEEKLTLTDSTLSPETISVNIVGEVRSPGLVKIKPNTPLAQAVLAAGGFDNFRANKKSVDLVRLNPDGTLTQRRIKLSFNGVINEETNPALLNNDVVMVRRSGIAAATDVFGRAFSPFFNFVRILPGVP